MKSIPFKLFNESSGSFWAKAYEGYPDLFNEPKESAMSSQLPVLTEESLEAASKIFKAEADARRALYDITGIKDSAFTHAADRETRNAIYKAAVAQTGKWPGEEFVETP